MRVLFTTQPALGHFHPLVPLAYALQHAGHAVAFASARSFLPTIAACGFECFPTGLDWLEADAARTFPQLRTLTRGQEASRWWATQIFAGVAARRMVPDLLTLIRSWRPDLIVRDPYEFGGCIAAESMQIPHATSGSALFVHPDAYRQLLAAPLSSLRRIHGLPPDRELAMLYRYLDLAFAPPAFPDCTDYVAPVVHFLRPLVFDHADHETLPEQIAQPSGRLKVYASLGTVFNRAPDIFTIIMESLRAEAIDLIVTVGDNQDTAQFPARAPHIQIYPYIPQTLIFPHCHAVITHGGFNTVMAALSFGLPMVIIPLAADQPANARRCSALEVARVIAPDRCTPPALRAALQDILWDSRYRRNAQRLCEGLQALPGPEYAVELLERLAVERKPQIARPGRRSRADRYLRRITVLVRALLANQSRQRSL